MELKKQLVIGLPKTGKTTFLAALWHVAESGEVKDSLEISEVHGSRDHLNKIRGEWLKCVELERTQLSAEKIVSLRLRNPQTNKVVELSLPDLSGETFRLQWESRQWSAEFERLALDCSAALLFVHPYTIIEPQRIDNTVNAMADVVGGKESEQSDSPQSWTPNHSPTQVKLVEILQFLQAGPFLKRLLPVAVIVSAWDLVGHNGSPADWFERRLPLLNQFLEANNETIPHEVFGISAQGGDLSAAKDLQHHLKASNRILVKRGNDATSHDITIPLKWLLELSE